MTDRIPPPPVEDPGGPSGAADSSDLGGSPDPASPDPSNPDDAFAAVISLRRLASALEREAVDNALAQGWTWASIGRALDMSAQAAHKRLSPQHRSAHK